MARIVFMGTPDFAVPPLKALLAHHEVVGVVTQPDRPAGRGKQVQMSPVKQVALAAGVPVFQPEKLRRAEAIDELRQWSADVYIVAAFGQILPQAVLDIPPHGCLNIHASLLPRWRGAAPIQAAIRAGDPESGITIMQMDAGLDTGAMLAKRVIPLAPDETGQSLHDKLCVIGAELLIETLPAILSGDIQPQPQDDTLATLAGRIDKNEGRIDWTESALHIERTVRAFTPWPGTFTTWEGKLLKILAVQGSGFTAHSSQFSVPGSVIHTADRIAIATGDGLLYPTRVQLEGKSAVTIDDFVRGYPAFVGAVLG
ncbi:MAG: methionyl-tRNA formyltransferase [Chloroflexota bacterium]|nr:methionyl-tRNA formyltransferase [Chloroflexota bacterium]